MSTNPPDEQPTWSGDQGGPTPPPPPGAGAQPPAGGYAGPPQGGYPSPPGYAPPGGNPAYGGGGYSTQPALSDSDQRMWATLSHILPIIGLSFLVPLVVWLVFKGRGQYLEEHAKEALNFQITLVIAAIAISIISVITLGLGTILYLAFIPALVFMILAAVAANRGEMYRYPVNIRIIN